MIYSLQTNPFILLGFLLLVFISLVLFWAWKKRKEILVFYFFLFFLFKSIFFFFLCLPILIGKENLKLVSLSVELAFPFLHFSLIFIVLLFGTLWFKKIKNLLAFSVLFFGILFSILGISDFTQAYFDLKTKTLFALQDLNTLLYVFFSHLFFMVPVGFFFLFQAAKIGERALKIRAVLIGSGLILAALSGPLALLAIKGFLIPSFLSTPLGTLNATGHLINFLGVIYKK